MPKMTSNQSQLIATSANLALTLNTLHTMAIAGADISATLAEKLPEMSGQANGILSLLITENTAQPKETK